MKAIIPIAGAGTRLLPLTFHQPKFFVGVADKPMIQYAVDELVRSGVREFVFVLSPTQTVIKKYIKSLNLGMPVSYVFQPKAMGNAEAVMRGLKKVGKEAVVLLFQDDVLVSGDLIMRKAIRVSKKFNAPVILVERVNPNLVSRYGIVKPGVSVRAIGTGVLESVFEIKDLVEKPKIGEAPSNLAIFGRYILTPDLFPYIVSECRKKLARGQKEYQITDAFRNYIANGGRILGIEFNGTRFDCGSKTGLMKAHAYFSLLHPDFGQDIRSFVKKHVK